VGKSWITATVYPPLCESLHGLKKSMVARCDVKMPFLDFVTMPYQKINYGTASLCKIHGTATLFVGVTITVKDGSNNVGVTMTVKES
jgi:hypothetical protein